MYVEMLRPPGLRQCGGLVPIVRRTVEKKCRPHAGVEEDEAVGGVRQGGPYLERCMCLEGVGAVVFEHRQERTGMHQQTAKAGGFQSARGTLADRVQVGSEGRFQSLAGFGSIHGLPYYRESVQWLT